MKFSVVIATRNRAALLDGALTSLRYEPTEKRLRIHLDGEPVAAFDALAGDWDEQSFRLPATPSPRPTVELRIRGAAVTVYHYWFD